MKNYLEKAITEFEKHDELRYVARLLKVMKITFRNEDGFYAAVNGNNELFLNDKWLSKQKQKVCNFILYHECLHIFLEHIERRGNHLPYLWNIANDLCINEGIRRHYFTEQDCFEMPKCGVSIEAVFKDEKDVEAFKKFIDYDAEDDIAKHFCSETIYQFLLKLGLENINENLDSDLIEDGEAEAGNSDGELEGSESELSEVQKEIITSILEEAREKELPIKNEISDIDSKDRKAGFGGDGKAKLNGIVKSNTRPVWLDKIFYTIKRIGNCKQVQTYARPNRRNYILQNYSKTRVTLPTYKREHELPTIHFHIDTSGSVSDYQLKKVIGEIESAIHLLKFEQVDIFFFSSIFYDTGIQIKQKETLDLDGYTFPGRSGTDLDNTFKQYENGVLKSPDIMIFITDGVFSVPKICYKVKPQKVYWVIEDNLSFRPPYWLKNSEVIHVKRR